MGRTPGSKNPRLTHCADSGPNFEPVRRVHTDHCGGTSPQILHDGGVLIQLLNVRLVGHSKVGRNGHLEVTNLVHPKPREKPLAFTPVLVSVATMRLRS